MSTALDIFSLRGLLFSPFYFLGFIRGTLVLLLALIFKGPQWFSQKTRTKGPACMDDQQLGTHKFIQIKDVNLHVVVSGDPKNPLMLFLHGFPECWYAWRYQIREFNKDYYCVSCDMRGAGESDAPLDKASYTLDKLTGDVKGLIEAHDRTSCILVGHDLGGMVAWDFAARYPNMVNKFIVINAAHPDRFRELIHGFFLPQLWLSWYVFFFQFPYLPELLISMGDYAILQKQRKKGSASKEDIEAFKYALSRPGQVKAMLNYYRQTASEFVIGSGQVDAPTLFIWSTGHRALHNKLAEGTQRYCPDLVVETVQDGDLLVHQDQPELINQYMRKYLQES